MLFSTFFSCKNRFLGFFFDDLQRIKYVKIYATEINTKDYISLLPENSIALKINLLNIVDDGYRRSAETSPGNITRNETTIAELNDSKLNPAGEGGVFDSDSEDELLASLLNQPGARFGQGEWVWTIVAQNADPDSLIPGAPDPDGGNDWTLTIVVTVLTPILTEVAYDRVS